MARNQEKSQAMLNRLIQAKKDAAAAPIQRRPFLASEVDNINDAERWRRQVIKEIARGVAEIQNGSLGEHKIRDLNDKINKLMREKRHWERQIKVLGGPDYYKSGAKITDSDGKGALGSGGYFYFGAAKALPGVREMFEKQVSDAATKKTRYELYKLVNADYYGYRDDDDGLLEKLERVQERKAVRQAVKDWKTNEREMKRQRLQKLGYEYEQDTDEADFDSEDEAMIEAASQDILKAHVPLPSEEEIEKALLAKRKEALLAKYGSQSEHKR